MRQWWPMSKQSRAKRAAMRADARAEMPPNLPATRADDWQNIYTALGTMKDKRLGTQIVAPTILSREDLSSMYRGSDVVATIVDLPADEMTREWIDFTADDDPENEVNSAVMDFLDGADEGPVEERTLQTRESVHEALKWARLYGGSVIVMGINDGKASDKPVNWDNIKSIDYLNVLDRWSIRPFRNYSDPLAPRYGKVELYMLQNENVAIGTNAQSMPAALRLVHESRVLRFDGVKLPPRDMARATNHGWGDSVLTRVWEVVRDYATVWMGFAYLLGDYAQTTIKMKNVAHALSRPDGQLYMKARMEAIEMSRSIARAVLIDAEEEFTRETTSLAGMPEAMQKFVERLAQAARMPIELLMGQPPGGINGNGETGLEYWYAQVNAMQERMLRPALMKLIRVVLASKEGPTKGVVPERWTVNFKPLDVPTEAERADVRLKIAQANASDVANGILDPEEAANSTYGSGAFSLDVKLDDDIREQLNDKHEQERLPGPSPEEQMNLEVAKAGAVAAAKGGQAPAVKAKEE